MAKKEYEIAFRLAAKMSAQFSRAFDAAKKAVGGVENEIAELNAESQKVSGLIKARKAVAESSKEYIAAKTRVAELGKAISRTAQPTQEMVRDFNAAKATLEKAKKSLERNRSSLRALNKETGATGQSLSSLVKRQNDLAAATQRATKAQQQQQKVQEKIQSVERLDAKVGGFNERMGRISSAATTSSVVAAGVTSAAGMSLLNVGADNQAALNKFQAATGESAANMAAIEKSARNVFALGIGESFAEVTASMATIRQTSGLVGQDLQNAARDALVLSQTFDMDVSESARASAALMKNFGISGSQAYDLIAYAAQNGANKNGDLLDTFNEYAVQYKALGFSAEQFAAHLVKGAQDGAFSIDKVGDAIKEFNIRAKDGSKSSMEAFDLLGLNGTKATQMFAAGGETAQKAFAEVVKRLNAMTDPVKRNAVGVALFGTQFEDLEAAALEGFSSIQSASVKAEGTIDSMAKTLGSDVKSQFMVISRGFQNAMAPFLKDASTAMSSQMPEIQSVIQQLMPSIERLGKTFAANFPTMLEVLTNFGSRVIGALTLVIDNFKELSMAAGIAFSAAIALRALGVLVQVFLNVYKGALIVQKALIALRSSMLVTSVASKTAAVGMNVYAVATKAAGVAMKFLMANPIVLFLSALVAAGVAVYKNWDALKAMAQNAAQAISSAWGSAMTSIKGFFTETFSSLANIMKGPINTIIAMINSMIDSINGLAFNVPDWVPAVGGQKFGVNLPKIPMLAEGGIATQPTLATIAEAGEAEAVIPLSKLSTMLQPMPAAGVAGGGSGSMTINFAPVINVQGGAGVAEAVRTAARSSYEEFKANVSRWQLDNRRKSFE